MMTAAPALIGRSLELTRLVDLLEESVQSHQSRVVVVRGEPGIGKTRLLTEFLDEARSQFSADDLLCGYGQAVMTSLQSDAFQAIRECLRGLADHAQRLPSPRLLEAVASAFWNHAPDWLESVPVVGQVLSAGLKTARKTSELRAGPTVIESPTDQLMQLLQNLAQKSPLLLVLDDLHWADTATIDLLTSVALKVNEPLMMVFAYRDGDFLRGAADPHPLASALYRLQRYRSDYVEIPLQRLSVTDTELLVWQIAGSHGLTRANVDDIVERSVGIPLFAESLSLVGQRRKRSADSTTALSIQSVLEERISFLTGDDRQLLEGAALIGTVFEVDYLAGLLRQDPDHLYDRLDVLLKEHGLVESSSPMGNMERYAIRHPPLVDVLRERAQLNAPRWRRMHKRLLEVLGPDQEWSQELLVRAAGYAVQSGESEVATRIGVRAAQSQFKMGGVSKARELADQVVGLADKGDPNLEDAYELLLTCLSAEASHYLAAELCETAAQDDRLVLSPERIRQLKLIWARNLRMANRWSDTIDMANEVLALENASALTLLGANATMLKAEVALCGPNQDVNECIRLCDLVLEGTQDIELRSRALGHIGLAHLAGYRPADADRWLRQAIEVAVENGHPYAQYEAIHWLSKKAIACLELAEARRLLDDLASNSQESGVASTVPFHLRDSSRVYALAGDWQRSAINFACLVDTSARQALGRTVMTLVCQTREVLEEHGPSAVAELLGEMRRSVDQQMVDEERRDLLARVVAELSNDDGTTHVCDFAVARLGVTPDQAQAADAIFRFDVASLSVLRAQFRRTAP